MSAHARRLLLVCMALVVVTFAPAVARAFHVGKTFADPPGAGGGGRIWYVGTALERGWECRMCHTDAPGLISLRVDVQPSELFQSFRYTLGTAYRFTVQLQGEHRGIGASRSNFNGLALAFADDAGIYQGSLGGFDPNVFFDGNGAIATSGTNVGETSWSFEWTAPTEPGRGRVTLFLGAVDGNGADSEPDVTRTDPFGDDVFMAQVLFEEGSATGARSLEPAAHGSRSRSRASVRSTSHPCSPTPLRSAHRSRIAAAAMWVFVAALVAIGLARPRRSR